MRNLRPIGIPHSIFLENLFARTFDASKLEEDSERVRAGLSRPRLLQGHRRRARHPHPQRGRALAASPSGPRRASASTSRMPIEEGERYRLGGITFTGNNARQERARPCAPSSPSRTATSSTPPLFGKGLDNLRRPTARSATSTSAPFPSRASTKQKKTVSLSTSTSMRASRSTSRASSSRATPSPATASSAASCCSKKARSTTAISGSRACSA